MVVGGVIYGIIYVINGIQASVASTKESYVIHDTDISLTAHVSHSHSLKTKGLNVSHTGISVKTSKRFDHEDYMDATRRCVFSHLISSSRFAYLSTSNFLRGLVKVAGASSFGKPENPTTLSPHEPISMERVPSDSSSITSQEKKKKKGIFRSRK